MKIGPRRICDICNVEIPLKTNFRQVTLEREALSAFLSTDDADLQPRWQEVGDGSGRVKMDICLECNANMGSGGLSA